MGVMNIKKQETLMDNPSKYWIHRIEEDCIDLINENKIIGSKSQGARTIKDIRSRDKIMFFAPIVSGKLTKISFIGYGVVEKVFNSNEELMGFDKSPRKIKLAGIKYFTSPVIAAEMDNLDFVENRKKLSNYFKSEYKQISKSDFKKIFRKSPSNKELPTYFENLSFNNDEFILNSITALFQILQNTYNYNQIEIKSFIQYLHDFLGYYGVSKSLNYLKNFYAYNVWKLNIEHSTSRDPKKFFVLYDSWGRSNELSYVKLR